MFPKLDDCAQKVDEDEDLIRKLNQLSLEEIIEEIGQCTQNTPMEIEDNKSIIHHQINIPKLQQFLSKLAQLKTEAAMNLINKIELRLFLESEKFSKLMAWKFYVDCQKRITNENKMTD